ncbi:MAG: hypothetical protein IJF30_02525 [Clostridia bacterium]|nr:hypothetical protein [Clostridia bacterium]
MTGLNKGVLKDGTKVFGFIDKAITGNPNKKMAILQSVFYNSEFTAEASHKVINDKLWEINNQPWWKKNMYIAEKLEKLH